MRWLFSLAAFLASACLAQEVTTEWKGLTLNANLVVVDDVGKRPVFLVLHGTWAHSGMEIIEATQTGLADRGFSSIAPTLSLGESDRTGFRDCSSPFDMRHEHAVDELGVWLEYLARQGVESVVLVGHSRGAAQVSLFQNQQPASMVSGLVLMGPMVFRENDHQRSGNRFLQCEDVQVTEDVIRSYYAADPVKHTPDLLHHIDVPVMVFLGSEDEIARWNQSEVSDVDRRDKQSVHVVEGADHFFRDLYLDDVLDKVVEYRW